MPVVQQYSQSGGIGGSGGVDVSGGAAGIDYRALGNLAGTIGDVMADHTEKQNRLIDSNAVFDASSEFQSWASERKKTLQADEKYRSAHPVTGEPYFNPTGPASKDDLGNTVFKDSYAVTYTREMDAKLKELRGKMPSERAADAFNRQVIDVYQSEKVKAVSFETVESYNARTNEMLKTVISTSHSLTRDPSVDNFMSSFQAASSKLASDASVAGITPSETYKDIRNIGRTYGDAIFSGMTPEEGIKTIQQIRSQWKPGESPFLVTEGSVQFKPRSEFMVLGYLYSPKELDAMYDKFSRDLKEKDSNDFQVGISKIRSNIPAYRSADPNQPRAAYSELVGIVGKLSKVAAKDQAKSLVLQDAASGLVSAKIEGDIVQNLKHMPLSTIDGILADQNGANALVQTYREDVDKLMSDTGISAYPGVATDVDRRLQNDVPRAVYEYRKSLLSDPASVLSSVAPRIFSISNMGTTKDPNTNADYIESSIRLQRQRGIPQNLIKPFPNSVIEHDIKSINKLIEDGNSAGFAAYMSDIRAKYKGGTRDTDNYNLYLEQMVNSDKEKLNERAYSAMLLPHKEFFDASIRVMDKRTIDAASAQLKDAGNAELEAIPGYAAEATRDIRNSILMTTTSDAMLGKIPSAVRSRFASSMQERVKNGAILHLQSDDSIGAAEAVKRSYDDLVGKWFSVNQNGLIIPKTETIKDVERVSGETAGPNSKNFWTKNVHKISAGSVADGGWSFSDAVEKFVDPAASARQLNLDENDPIIRSLAGDIFAKRGSVTPAQARKLVEDRLIDALTDTSKHRWVTSDDMSGATLNLVLTNNGRVELLPVRLIYKDPDAEYINKGVNGLPELSKNGPNVETIQWAHVDIKFSNPGTESWRRASEMSGYERGVPSDAPKDKDIVGPMIDHVTDRPLDEDKIAGLVRGAEQVSSAVKRGKDVGGKFTTDLSDIVEGRDQLRDRMMDIDKRRVTLTDSDISRLHASAKARISRLTNKGLSQKIKEMFEYETGRSFDNPKNEIDVKKYEKKADEFFKGLKK